MAQYLRERLTVRVSSATKKRLQDLAAAEGVDTSVYARDLLARAVRQQVGSHAADPLAEALHAVLPRYFQRLHDLVAAARYDAIMARELAQAAAFAALLAGGRSQEQARQLVHNTLGRAAKIAARRMRDRHAEQTDEPEGAGGDGDADESAGGG